MKVSNEKAVKKAQKVGKQITLAQYGKMFTPELTRQGVLWRINHKIPLPGVAKFELIGNTYIITLEIK